LQIEDNLRTFAEKNSGVNSFIACTSPWGKTSPANRQKCPISSFLLIERQK
jgi:hypothetical protein